MYNHFQVNTIAPMVPYQAFQEHLLCSQLDRPLFVYISSESPSITRLGTQQIFLANSTSKAAGNILARRIDLDDDHIGSLIIHPGFTETRIGCAGANFLGLSVKKSVDQGWMLTSSQSAQRLAGLIQKGSKMNMTWFARRSKWRNAAVVADVE